jgi:large subunit ribosomal protein L15
MAKTKTKKFRRSRTCGRGKKGGRGAGLRGGRGNAGLGKHRFMHMMKYMPDHFGSSGFKRPQCVTSKDRVINVGQLEERFPGKATIDLGKEGFDKLLGAGSLDRKLKVKVDNASEKAISKIREKGGEITLPEVKDLKDKDAQLDNMEKDVKEG